MSRDPLDPFERPLLEAVAADHGLDVDVLRALLRQHQEQMRELPGVEGLVYEWRKALPRDPLVERREDAYLLLLEPNVWPQFADALGFDETEFAAVRAAHADQIAVTTESAQAGDDSDDREPMVVTRE